MGPSRHMASLLDAGFEILSVDRWIDPAGNAWDLDFTKPMAIPAIRQLLTHYLKLGLWDRAQHHTFGSSLSLYPDLKPLKARIRQAKKHARWQEHYFLSSLPQLVFLQTIWLILYFCAVPRINHLLRTVPLCQIYNTAILHDVRI